jgi:hypothetical protein
VKTLVQYQYSSSSKHPLIDRRGRVGSADSGTFRKSFEEYAATRVAAINDHATETQRKMKSWPPSPAALMNRIERAAPVLRSQYVRVQRRRTRADRLITIVALVLGDPMAFVDRAEGPTSIFQN